LKIPLLSFYPTYVYSFWQLKPFTVFFFSRISIHLVKKFLTRFTRVDEMWKGERWNAKWSVREGKIQRAFCCTGQQIQFPKIPFSETNSMYNPFTLKVYVCSWKFYRRRNTLTHTLKNTEVFKERKLVSKSNNDT
jgi:hypothetical protein